MAGSSEAQHIFAVRCVFGNFEVFYVGPSPLLSNMIVFYPLKTGFVTSEFEGSEFLRKYINPPKLHIVNCRKIAIYCNLRMALEGARIYVGILILKILMWKNLDVKDQQNRQKHILQQKNVVAGKSLQYGQYFEGTGNCK